eukprot:Rmarinus@m.7466
MERKLMSFPVRGVEVAFPMRPYAPQLQMMNHVINALEKGQNALLESPTGTGKTLALLCSSLAWQKHHSKMAAETTSEILQPTTKNSLLLEIGNSKTHPESSENNAGDDYDDYASSEELSPDDDFVAGRVKRLREPGNKKMKSKLLKEEKDVEENGNNCRIYYGTRTHSQISHAVNELRKT